jgi:hypothetical protein
MSNYVVAIPSYKREEVLVKKSLKTLKEGGVPASKIHIFVANKEECENYEKVVPKDLYHKIVVGVKGITNQRKFIVKYFPENQYVISIDDDVEQIEKMKGPDKLLKVKNVDAFFKEGYIDLKKHNLYIWGIYPVRNPFFMKPKTTVDLKFIIGVLRGFINRHFKELEPSPSAEGKEDYEQSILYFKKDGGVLRYNNITTKTKFNSEGGLGKDRFDMNKRAADYLKKTYPDLVTIFHRKNGMTEIKLKKISGEKSTAPTKKKATNVKNKTKRRRKSD